MCLGPQMSNGERHSTLWKLHLQIHLLFWFFFSFLSIYLFIYLIYLFTFGCVESSLLSAGFL